MGMEREPKEEEMVMVGRQLTAIHLSYDVQAMECNNVCRTWLSPGTEHVSKVSHK